MDKDILESPIQYIKGVGPRRAALLSRLNIKTARDALYYLPCRYVDRRNIKKICHLAYGRMETAVGKIAAMDIINRPRLKIFELIVSDGTGILKAKWFNQPYMKKLFRVGQEVILSGVVKADRYRGAGFEIDSPEYEFVDEDTESFIHTARIVPVYGTTAGLSVRVLRNIQANVLDACLKYIEDPVDDRMLARHGLPGLKESIYNSHFPEAEADIDAFNRGISRYQRRLSFNELLSLELGIAMMKKNESGGAGIAFNPKGDMISRLTEKLPFKLTNAQGRVLNEILLDMKKPHPMNRLIQGDVGCGKTVVALLSMVAAVECGYQAAIMAPTEILAEQHYMNIHKLVGDMGLEVCLLAGGRKDKPVKDLESGKTDIAVGTHALIQEGVIFKKLGLVVIDEQHRFGVMQRAALRGKAYNPDMLIMTATPIPRTLAITVYGDLDCSVIDELPPNRSPVITRFFYSNQKPLIYQAISAEVKKGRQVYVVYPVIEESENTDLKSAITGKEALEKMFPEFRISLLHGKMKLPEREAVMMSFKGRGIDILVSTTVIEVGVDVPNASMMLIVHAERFGLSQLHQLRGRVGRGSEQSFCYLLAYGHGEDGRKRLDIMTKTNDGFRIADEDLNIRGPGDFLGTRQSGMPDLKIANIMRDASLLEIARKEAFAIISADPGLNGYPMLKQFAERFWKGKMDAFKTA